MEEKIYYYQIKGRKYYDWMERYDWSFPPIYSGFVTATSRKQAREKINEEYSQKFPCRVLIKDIENQEFLLSVDEASEYDLRLLDENICKVCGKKFRRIDLYNDSNVKYKGTEFCSDECKKTHNQTNEIEYIQENKDSLPVIYKITYKPTGQCYIGQTTQSFTLRWWRHFKGKSDCKFQQKIRQTKLTDWTFEVIEVCDDKSQLNEREKFFINQYKSVENGFNFLGQEKSNNSENYDFFKNEVA